MNSKRKDGNYETTITYEQNGETKRKHIYYKDTFELTKKITAFKQELTEREKIYFSHVASEWKDSHFAEIAGGTQISYTSAYNRAVDILGEKEIKDISPLDVQRILDGMAKQKYSAQTIRVQRIVINLIFKHAVLYGYIDNNSVSAVSVPRNLPKAQRDHPSDEDIEKVKSSADAFFGMFAYFLLYTGCRRGEALGLQWRDVDFKNKIIHISKSVNYSGANQNLPVLSPHPKTEAGVRDIIILDCLFNRLKDMRGKSKDDDFLFGGTTPLTKTAYRNRWEKYKKETGINFTPHQFRHAYATILYEAGIDEKIAQGLMGHSSIQVTKDTYTHIRQNKRDDATKALNDYINTLKENTKRQSS